MIHGRRKIVDLFDAIRKAVDSGNYLDTRHAMLRQEERRITRNEILYVLGKGRHEPGKDKFVELYEAWNYAIRGRTVDRRELRVIVSFDKEILLIITAMPAAR